MVEMNSMERIQAVLGGEKPDRPPVGFWHHFPPNAVCGRAAVEAHLDHLNRYDLDFLKIMNDNPYPTQLDVRRAGDLRDIPILSGTEDEFTAQPELIEAAFGIQVMVITHPVYHTPLVVPLNPSMDVSRASD
ncbi:MAG: hypothetical protein IH897_09490 [Planctomycetes bacterium]|nr:hypothetical protein [Planctomycetota bacterium]